MTPGQPVPALARSLGPLPDESLPGLLLRLSHRLGLSPRRVAELTGLGISGPRGVLSLGHLLTMDSSTLNRFAQATALTPAEAAALTLAGFRRYPPLDGLNIVYAKSYIRTQWPSWVLQPSSRYCPQCLAGDGTTIQNLHGGSWRRTWRLGVTFACLHHQRLLLTTCPSCAKPASHRSLGESLIPRERVVLHPAQCRSVVDIIGRRRQRLCEARLDELPPENPDIDGRFLALQQRIFDMLDPTSPTTTTVLGQTTPVVRYFADLRLISTLIQTSWDRAREVAATIAPIDALDISIEQRTNHAGQAAAPASPAGRSTQSLPQLPTNVSAVAALLLVADSILTSEPSTVRSLLNPVIATASHEHGWKWQWAQQRSACSPVLTELLAAETERVRRPDRRRIRKPGPAKPTDSLSTEATYRFNHSHIPQCLETPWCEEQLSSSFSEDAGINPVHFKRTIAIRLVELSERTGPTAGARRLGSPYSLAAASRVEVLRWLANDPAHQDRYQSALHALVENLNSASHLIDYGRRRQVLSDWSLSQKGWSRILAEQRLPGFTEDTGGDRTLADEVSRLAASAFIWARVTGGEAKIAPAVVAETGGKTSRRAMVGRAMSIYAYRVKQGRPGFLAFQSTLDNFADELTKSIDTGRPDVGAK